MNDICGLNSVPIICGLFSFQNIPVLCLCNPENRPSENITCFGELKALKCNLTITIVGPPRNCAYIVCKNEIVKVSNS